MTSLLVDIQIGLNSKWHLFKRVNRLNTIKKIIKCVNWMLIHKLVSFSYSSLYSVARKTKIRSLSNMISKGQSQTFVLFSESSLMASPTHRSANGMISAIPSAIFPAKALIIELKSQPLLGRPSWITRKLFWDLLLTFSFSLSDWSISRDQSESLL